MEKVKWDSDLRSLREDYDDIFIEPNHLPPPCPTNHRIPLPKGTNPINVRPYKYAHIQKNEIERLMTEMLQLGIIRPSNSPFSSPIFLVKKKDGGWRFYVDYRALIRATVPDKFPIPLIEELLDELHESSLYSKIDLKSGYLQIRMRAEDVPKTALSTRGPLRIFGDAIRSDECHSHLPSFDEPGISISSALMCFGFFR